MVSRSTGAATRWCALATASTTREVTAVLTVRPSASRTVTTDRDARPARSGAV